VAGLLRSCAKGATFTKSRGATGYWANPKASTKPLTEAVAKAKLMVNPLKIIVSIPLKFNQTTREQNP